MIRAFLAATVTAALTLAVGTSPASATDFLESGSYVSSQSTLATPLQGAPTEVGGAYTDQTFGTTVRRLSVSSSSSQGYVPEYSKAQAFNSDGSRFLVRGTDAKTYLYNGFTLASMGELPIPQADLEPRWSPSDPDKLTYIDNDGTPSVKEYSLSSGQSRTVGSYGGFGGLSSGAEQDRSRSGRYFALHGDETYDSQGNWVSTQAFVADLSDGSRGPATTLTPPSPGDFLDYVAITPDDQYVMVMWAGAGARLYTKSWTFVRQLTDWDEHADFCRRPNGDDVLVIAHYRAGPNDEVVESRPLSGAPGTLLWQAPTYNMALHISCRNTSLPGWAFMSSYWDGIGQRPGATPFENEVFALSLDSSVSTPVVRRLAHTQMIERADYFDEPHATVRQDGRLVLFASNFNTNVGSDSYDDTYAIDLRSEQPQTDPGGVVDPGDGSSGGATSSTKPLQELRGTVKTRMRIHATVALPRKTTIGRAIKWKSLTPMRCRIAHNKSVVSEMRGMCRITASAQGSSSISAFRHRYRISIRG